MNAPINLPFFLFFSFVLLLLLVLCSFYRFFLLSFVAFGLLLFDFFPFLMDLLRLVDISTSQSYSGFHERRGTMAGIVLMRVVYFFIFFLYSAMLIFGERGGGIEVDLSR